MQTTDFSKDSPGQLVPTIEQAIAFVPNPLPHRLDLSLKTVGLLAKAENALGHLNGVTGRLVNPYLIGSPLLHREAILSSRIEGTVTTPEDLVLFEASGRLEASGTGREEDAREVANYMRAMRHGLRRLSELPVSLRLIRELHAELLRGVRGERERPGEFRTTQNFIGRKDQSIREARFVPPPVSQMNAALNDFESYLHQEWGGVPMGHEDPARSEEDALPLLIRLALVHYQFETIHPFRDGNGRIGRLLIPLLLCSHARLEEPLLYLSSYFERLRETYFDLLLRVSQRGDWEDWLQFFLRGVAECSTESSEQAQGLLELRNRYHSQFQRARSSALLIRLIDRLFQTPSITRAQSAELLGVTPAAASSNLRKLEDVGIIHARTSKNRGRVFVATEILAFMHDSSAARSVSDGPIERVRTVAADPD